MGSATQERKKDPLTDKLYSTYTEVYMYANISEALGNPILAFGALTSGRGWDLQRLSLSCEGPKVPN